MGSYWYFQGTSLDIQEGGTNFCCRGIIVLFLIVETQIDILEQQKFYLPFWIPNKISWKYQEVTNISYFTKKS